MDYDFSIFPPAPRLEIRLIALPHNAVYGPISAFVDTGADATIVPLDIVRQLRAGAVTLKRCAVTLATDTGCAPTSWMSRSERLCCLALRLWVMTLQMKPSWAGMC